MKSTITRLAAAAMIVAPALQAQSIVYAPGGAKYHVTSVSTTQQTQQGQQMDFTVNSDQWLTVTIAPKSRDTLSYTIVLDSMRISASNPMIPVPDVSKMKGVAYHGLISTNGKRYGGALSDTTVDETKSLADGFERFLPQLPATAKFGSTWNDNVSSKANRGGIDIKSDVVVAYTLAGDTTVAGQKAWRITRAGTITATGSGNTQGQAVIVEQSGKLDGSSWVSSAGRFLGSHASQTMSGKITLPAAGMEIPQSQKVTTTVEILK